MNLKQQIALDINHVFSRDATEFNDRLIVGTGSDEEYIVFGSMQSNMVDNGNFSNSAPLQGVSNTLYCPYPIGGKLYLTAGQVIFIDHNPYKVIDVSDEMGLATILIKQAQGYYGAVF